jgi:3-hydroxyisobutyrate dehydrogenase-like beta-hydroxyacid dehydrogenase
MKNVRVKRGSRNVGFIGLGDLGGAIARRMLDRGVRLTVFDPDPETLRRIVPKGATAGKNPRTLGAASEVVFLCLPHPDVLREVALGRQGLVRGMADGAIVVDMSTSGPDAVREVGSALEARGIRMIDAAVGKGPWATEKGDLTLMLGGDEKTCGEVGDLLRLVASRLYHCGPLGAGQVVKLVNNLASCANLAVAVEAVSLARSCGADLSVVTEVLPQTAADSWHLRHTVIEKALRRGDFDPIFKLGLARKDLRLAIALAEGSGAPANCARGALDWYDRGLEAGLGDRDQCAIMLTAGGLDAASPGSIHETQKTGPSGDGRRGDKR